MSFVRIPEGKNVFISIDSRVSQHNHFYKALKAKSFTDGDITLHFILFDILNSPEVLLSLPEILDEFDEYLSEFKKPMVFDESTVRKKLKEYTELGIVEAQKDGRKMIYKRASDVNLPDSILRDRANQFAKGIVFLCIHNNLRMEYSFVNME